MSPGKPFLGWSMENLGASQRGFRSGKYGLTVDEGKKKKSAGGYTTIVRVAIPEVRIPDPHLSHRKTGE